MTFEEFAKATDASPAQGKMLLELDALQNRLALKLSTLLGDLDTTGGRINPTPANIRAIEAIMQSLRDDFADPRWTRAVVAYLASFDGIDTAIKSYMGAFGTLDEEALNAVKRGFKASTAAYLTNPESFTGDLWLPLASNIQGAVTTGETLSGAIQAAQDQVTGVGDTMGALVNAAQGPTSTASTVYQRSATQVAADKVGAEFFRYQGRSIDTTRPFCKARAGKVYHRKEIEEWGRQAASGNAWEGAFEGTDSRNIFVHLGGYYGKRSACRHVLVPLPRRDVPKEDLDRMRDKGLID